LHVDTKPGNRAATCHAQMQPVALTFKRSGTDKYGRERSGDVMIVHLCKGCRSININRIAADDSSHRIFEVFQNSMALDHGLHETMHNGGVNILQIEDAIRLQNAIYGKRL
jgi:ribosome biogenesis GTPase